MAVQIPPFHIAFAVHDLSAAREFYSDILGCREGRSSDSWVDFDLYGHQIVAHLVSDLPVNKGNSNPVDGKQVPVPHFGVVLDMDSWNRLADHLRESRVEFAIEPYVRFAGQQGEQATLFVRDPSGNALEFKAFKDIRQLFAS